MTQITMVTEGLSLLAALHEFNAVLEEDVSVLVTESFCLICDLSSKVLHCEPCGEPQVVVLTRKLHAAKFLGGGAGVGGAGVGGAGVEGEVVSVGWEIWREKQEGNQGNEEMR